MALLLFVRCSGKIAIAKIKFGAACPGGASSISYLTSRNVARFWVSAVHPGYNSITYLSFIRLILRWGSPCGNRICTSDLPFNRRRGGQIVVKFSANLRFSPHAARKGVTTDGESGYGDSICRQTSDIPNDIYIVFPCRKTIKKNNNSSKITSKKHHNGR